MRTPTVHEIATRHSHNENLMATNRYHALSGIALLRCGCRGGETNLAAAIRYTAPTNFYEALPINLTDPGDDPLSTTGPTFLRYVDRNERCGEVEFSLGWAGVFAGEGKVLKFMRVEPKELKELMELQYRGKFPQASPAVVTNLAGATAVSLTATRPPQSGIMPYFLHFCWIQLETNAVLKVDAVSCNAETFKALTNSMASIKIDKAQLLKAFKPQRE